MEEHYYMYIQGNQKNTEDLFFPDKVFLKFSEWGGVRS